MHSPLLDDPIQLFQNWFQEAAAAGEPQPEAVALATSDADGRPSVRLVLLKGVTPDGFAFFTNYESRKSREMDVNPRAAMVFFWKKTQKQVRVEGRVERVPPAESREYFATRPRGSQLSAWASHQSQVLPDREQLRRKVAELEREYEGVPVPCPPFWGGFRLLPEVMEFWIGQPDRLHDRFRFRRDATGWVIERLSP